MDVKDVQFPEFGEESHGKVMEPKAFEELPLQISVELGQAKLSFREVVELQEGSIVELGRLAGEPLDVKVGNQLVAQGEVVSIDDHYGIRVTHVVSR